ncbi:40S ribosomal protein S5-1 [Hordeum vulgare]|nr:40S ribosomal protein S5-1 [Hordeum vulgare]
MERVQGGRREEFLAARAPGNGEKLQLLVGMGRGPTGGVVEEGQRGGEGSAGRRGCSEDKIFEKVINPYLTGVLQHPQSIEIREGMLHIRDVEGPKKTRSMETRLEAMEQQVFKCQGMVERGLNANHMMIMEFTNKHMIDANDIGKHLSRIYDMIDQLQAQIYDLQN